MCGVAGPGPPSPHLPTPRPLGTPGSGVHRMPTSSVRSWGVVAPTSGGSCQAARFPLPRGARAAEAFIGERNMVGGREGGKRDCCRRGTYIHRGGCRVELQERVGGWSSLHSLLPTVFLPQTAHTLLRPARPGFVPCLLAATAATSAPTPPPAWTAPPATSAARAPLSRSAAPPVPPAPQTPKSQTPTMQVGGCLLWLEHVWWAWPGAVLPVASDTQDLRHLRSRPRPCSRPPLAARGPSPCPNPLQA